MCVGGAWRRYSVLRSHRCKPIREGIRSTYSTCVCTVVCSPLNRSTVCVCLFSLPFLSYTFETFDHFFVHLFPRLVGVPFWSSGIGESERHTVRSMLRRKTRWLQFQAHVCMYVCTRYVLRMCVRSRCPRPVEARLWCGPGSSDAATSPSPGQGPGPGPGRPWPSVALQAAVVSGSWKYEVVVPSRSTRRQYIVAGSAVD